MLRPPVDAGVGANRAATSRATLGTFNWRNMMSGVTWEATIRLPENGDQVRVRVVAPTHFAARQLIELEYDAEILFGPVRTDLMRAV
jgi:hypothetical protein